MPFVTMIPKLLPNQWNINSIPVHIAPQITMLEVDNSIKSTSKISPILQKQMAIALKIGLLRIREQLIESDIKEIFTFLYHHREVTKLSIHNNILSQKHVSKTLMQTLSEHLSHGGDDELGLGTNIQEVFLGSSGIDDAGAKALASALARNPQIKALHLDNNHITDVGIEAISSILCLEGAPGGLRELSINGNPITDVGVISIAKSLCKNGLRTLEAEHTLITNIGAEAIAHALPTSSLESLTLDHTKVGDQGATAIAGALRGSRLQELSLDHIGMSDVGAKSLGEALPSSNALNVLSIANNRIKSSGAKVIAHHLSESVLRHLFIGENQITDDGGRMIADTLLSSDCLDELGMEGNRLSDDIVSLLQRAANRVDVDLTISRQHAAHLQNQRANNIKTMLSPHHHKSHDDEEGSNDATEDQNVITSVLSMISRAKSFFKRSLDMDDTSTNTLLSNAESSEQLCADIKNVIYDTKYHGVDHKILGALCDGSTPITHELQAINCILSICHSDQLI